VITIEDSGLVMSESALARAEAAVSGTASNSRGAGAPDLSSLSGTRLGLAVVGLLARKHGLTVSYRPSAIGGTAVVVVVPRELITRVDQTAHTSLTTPTPPPITAPAPSEPLTVGGSELPKRRRGSTLTAVHPDGLTAPKHGTPVAPKTNPAQLSAFQRVFTGRDQAVPPPLL